MGIELQLQAIPEDSTLFQCAKEKPSFYGLLQFLNFYSQMPRQKFDALTKHRSGHDAEFDEFVALLHKTWAEYPGIAQRNVYLDRRWHILKCTLSAFYGEQDWIKLALDGGPALWSWKEADTQYPLGFLPSSEVPEVARYVAELNLAQIEEQWNPSVLREAGVYKAHHLDMESWRWIEQDLVNLQSFYAEVSAYGLAVLSIYS